MILSTTTTNTKWHGCGSFSSSDILPVLKPRKKIGVIKVGNESYRRESESDELNTKKANLSASRKERVQLPIIPNYEGKKFPIGEFLSQPCAIEALLNTNALKSFQCLSPNTYRCTLQRLKLLNFEVAPVLDLRVTPTNQDCTVEMLSCKFEGSKIMEQQNNHFTAFMRNRMSWDTSSDEDSFLEVDIKLNLILEIYTRPFTMMPVSTVERPGNLMLQALLDRLVPLLLQQLLQDYSKWVHQQLDSVSPS
ncbi:hypothetical protein CsatB_008245 [Cannabis sativa]|uniref:DUF1997 family protein n=3 Tax=Cannabis sativa TaxID=3483 RepID=A0A7J6G2K7_CANSA|nr:uncharacterized protein LOC115697526 [Cannabis sativa]KAF4351050.1 hypothetical protein G4B88_026088 [Cannabis sativa]KAF4377233.1 hypothetical protein F8388_012334 [Cannabis sativa]